MPVLALLEIFTRVFHLRKSIDLDSAWVIFFSLECSCAFLDATYSRFRCRDPKLCSPRLLKMLVSALIQIYTRVFRLCKSNSAWMDIFKIIHGLCPAYLSSLLQQYPPQRSLRSSSKFLFTVHTVNSVTYGKRAFSFSAPILWNSLPDSVKNTTSLSSFKSALKAFLFRKSYFWFILFYEKLF